MLQQENPEDFVIATGWQYRVREFISWTAEELGMQLKWRGKGVDEKAYWNDKPVIQIDPRYFRPAEVETLLGDPSKAKHKFGWMPEITVQQMCAEMVATDLSEAKRNAYLKSTGFKVNICQG